MKNARLLIVIPLLVIPMALTQGCATVKPIVKTLSDVAYYLCIHEKMQEADKVGFTPEEIGKAFCATDIALKPFIDALLAAKKLKAEGPAPALTCPPAAPAPVCPSAAPVASVKAPPAASVKAPAPSASAAPKKPGK